MARDGIGPSQRCLIPLSGSVYRVRTTYEIWWLGAELNHRHKDFQSSALPTELPSHVEAIETALKYSPAAKTPKTEPTH